MPPLIFVMLLFYVLANYSRKCLTEANTNGKYMYVDAQSVFIYYNNMNNDRFVCMCHKGYYWSIELNKCLPLENICSIYNPCGPPDGTRGDCQLSMDTSFMYKCVCRPAYRGEFCHIKNNPCLAEAYTCGEGFECVRDPSNLVVGFRCKCEAKLGYQPLSKANPACVDVDECNTYKEICKNGGTCVNKYGAYTCTCLAAFTGKHCEIDERFKNYGTWQRWGPWEKCSVNCGDGHQTAYRNCSVAYMCSGSNSRTKKCERSPPCTNSTHSELLGTVVFHNELDKMNMLEYAYRKMSIVYEKYFGSTNSSMAFDLRE